MSLDRAAAKRLSIRLALLLTLAGAVVCPRTCRAGRAELTHPGMYVGVLAQQLDLSGDFDGSSLIVGGYGVGILPSLSTGHGYDLGLDFLFRPAALEVTYARADHDAVWLGARGDATTYRGDLDVPIFLRPTAHVLPYGLLGVGFDEVVARSGAVDLDRVVNAEYSGLGFNAGGGLMIRPLPRLILDFSAIHHSIRINTFTPKGGLTMTIDDGLHAEGWSYRGGLLWRLVAW